MGFMCFDDLSDYRQAKARAFLFRRKKRHEYISAVFGGDAASAVSHVKYEVGSPGAIADRDGLPCRGGLDGIRKEIDQNLLHSTPV